MDGVRDELLLLKEDSWTKSLETIEEAIWKIADFRSKSCLKVVLDDLAFKEIIDVKAVHSYMLFCPQPTKWFKLQIHVNDSSISKTL